jgi:EAL domain-containing protein (putative c-di-GMP-specific phosphodiesterase class I)
VERGELVVYYQPQQDIKTRQLTGVEALVRWNHPELGVLAPAQFISLAEEIGLIIQVDQWVCAPQTAKSMEVAGHAPLIVTTNLSAPQFQQPGLVK